MSEYLSDHSRRAPVSPKLTFGLVAPANMALPSIARRIEAAGHTVETGADIRRFCGRDGFLDAVLLTTPASPSQAMFTDALLAGAGALPCLVLVGDASIGSARFRRHASFCEFLSDPVTNNQLEAILDRLAWRRTATATIMALGDQLEERQLELDAQQDEFVGLAGRMSHEMQAELKHISGFAQKLQESACSRLTPGEVHHLHLIRDSASKGQAVTRDLLALAQLRLTRAEASRVDLGQVVADCIRDLGASATGVDWKLGHLPAVTGDRAMLGVALSHLVNNAMKFSRSKARPCIETIAIASTTGTMIQLLDNGIGFDEALAHRLFVPLERLHPGSEYEGNGLGLAMVKAIMDRHGGKVAAHARPAGGAAFSLWFPPSDNPTAGPDRSMNAAVDVSHAGQARPRSQKVLLVDDDALVLATVREMLLREGHDVLVAENSEVALALLRGESSPFGAVVSDWYLPGLDGPALAVEAKLIDSRTATILLSGKLAPGGLREGPFPPYVDHLLGKPVLRSELRRALSNGTQAETTNTCID